jgi:exopolysaccharide production protein ExoZ
LVTANQPATGPANRLLTIDVARGMASLSVLLFHSLPADTSDTLNPILGAVQHFTQYGWMGVYMFFAISGWCITQRVAAGWRRKEPVQIFLRERALRIYPTYWAAFGLALALRLAAVPFNTTHLADNLPSDARSWLANLFLLKLNPYLNTTFILLVSWTLVFELGFYLLAAGALILRRRVPVSTLALLGMLLCLWPLSGWQFRLTYMLGLWPDFFAGGLAWWAARSHTRAPKYLAAAGLAMLALLNLGWPGGYGGQGRLAAIATAATLWALAGQDHRVAAIPFLRKLAWVGGFSYSLYLIHLPLLSPFLNLAQRWVSPHHALFCLVWLAGILLAFTGGWLLNRLVEAPVERWRKQARNSIPAPQPTVAV